MKLFKSREDNPWAKTFGPVYTAEGLTRRDVTPDDSLVSIHSSEGTVYYPHSQFRAVGQIEAGLARFAVRTRGF